MSDLLNGLNPEQRQAAEVCEGPLLVLAGAGSGKTRVLTHRIAHLLEKGVRPWQIMAVTFTNKAASEMKERVRRLVGPAAEPVLVSTFHSTCARFLRRDIEHLGDRTGRFSIYDDDDQKRLIRQIMGDLGVTGKAWTPNKLRGAIDRAKNAGLSPDQIEKKVGDPTEQVYRAYESRLLAANALDFNDLVNQVVRLFEQCPAVLARYQARYRHLMVDEYQDTNRAQYRLVRLLAGPLQAPDTGWGDTRSVMVVGDDDQSIYGFRGADIRNILDFQKDFADAHVVRLEQNYRSTSRILAAANAVVANNRGRMEKRLWTEEGDGAPVILIAADDEPAEAEKCVDRMRLLKREGVPWGDMAVIYRTNAASRVFEQSLVKHRVPHVLVGARKFYERREVRDIVCYLRLVVNPTDDAAFRRVVNVPRRGLGAKGLASLSQAAQADGRPMLYAARAWSAEGGRGRKGVASFVKLIDRLGEKALELEPGEVARTAAMESGYAAELEAEDTEEARGRLENLQQLYQAIADEPEDGDDDTALGRLQRFLDRASLAGQSDELPGDDTDGRVTLLTAHLAKGLEFPVVFVAGLYEGGFPHFMSRESEDGLEEERRLTYVAITRAERRLFLTRPRRRLNYGEGFQYVEPSRFLSEIPRDVVQHEGRSGFSGSTVSREDRARRLGFGAATQRKAPAWASMKAELARPAPEPVMPVGEHRTVTPEDLSDLDVGVRVLHPKFGVGVIQRAEGSPQNRKLRVEFDGVGRKVLFARHANLEILI